MCKQNSASQAPNGARTCQSLLVQCISLEKLIAGIEKAQGRCIEVSGQQEDAKYRILNQENLKFEISYTKEQPEESKLFAVAREFGKVLLS